MTAPAVDAFKCGTECGAQGFHSADCDARWFAFARQRDPVRVPPGCLLLCDLTCGMRWFVEVRGGADAGYVREWAKVEATRQRERAPTVFRQPRKHAERVRILETAQRLNALAQSPERLAEAVASGRVYL